MSLLFGLPSVRIVLAARNGAGVVELVKKSKVHIVLMDIEMPGMNGMETTRLIKGRVKTGLP